MKKEILPKYLYHYYEKSRGPFRSLSESGKKNFKTVMSEIAQSSIKLNRFTKPEQREFYYSFRKYTEKKIRTLFTEKGGKPVLEYPRYMTLGPTDWFLDWYDNVGIIKIPLDEFNDNVISFTYPDSFISLIIEEQRWEHLNKYKMNYHGKVFTKKELPYLIEQYGLPEETKQEYQHFGNRIIEAQIWDLEVINKYLKNHLTNRCS